MFIFFLFLFFFKQLSYNWQRQAFVCLIYKFQQQEAEGFRCEQGQSCLFPALAQIMMSYLAKLYTANVHLLHSFFMRTSRFCLRLAVLNIFSFLRLKCSEFVLISPTEPCNATKKNVRLTTRKTPHSISFILFLSSSAHRQRLGGVLQKSCSAIVLKSIKKYLQKSSLFY